MMQCFLPFCTKTAASSGPCRSSADGSRSLQAKGNSFLSALLSCSSPLYVPAEAMGPSCASEAVLHVRGLELPTQHAGRASSLFPFPFPFPAGRRGCVLPSVGAPAERGAAMPAAVRHRHCCTLSGQG